MLSKNLQFFQILLRKFHSKSILQSIAELTFFFFEMYNISIILACLKMLKKHFQCYTCALYWNLHNFSNICQHKNFKNIFNFLEHAELLESVKSST